MSRLPILGIVVLALVGCRDQAGKGPAPQSRHAQRLTSSTISDPKTFNPIISVDASSAAATEPLFEGLVRLNPRTLEQEPTLAERWERNDAGNIYTFFLRKDVRWHDGAPFTAEDVKFTFDAIFDARVPNSIKHILTIDGQPLTVEVVDAATVRIGLPHPFAPLMSAIGVSILPKHILGPALSKGTFAQQWGIDTPPGQIIGTGPYRMARYVPAQFIEFQRDPTYWMRDDAGQPLPYLEGLVDLIVPNQDTMYLKFLAGQTDVHGPRPEEVADLTAKADSLKITVQEVGIDTGSTFVAFNRNPRYYVKNGVRDPRLAWFTDPRFLRALAHAVDKRAMIVNCLNGYGQPAIAEISPANRLFHNPHLTDYAYDLEAARRLLDEAGFRDRNGDGIREDADGHPVEFSLTTNAGNQVREKMCSILKEDWTKLGLKVNYRPLDFQALVEKLSSTFEWDAVLIGFTGTLEPNNGANLLRSNGNLHFWDPGQPKPATAWEAEIDQLLDEGARALDLDKRQAAYWRIQTILHEQLPMLQTVRQTTFVAYTRSLRNYDRMVWGLYRPELIRFAD